ncbi:MAG: isochorismate synthase [Cyanobacteria bacterium P01_F01_bin.42]
MQFTPSRIPLAHDLSVFRRLLAACQSCCREDDLKRLVSVSIDIPTVDPLAVLEKWRDDNEHFFYWERPTQSVAVAAFCPELVHAPEHNRFSQTQEFIDATLEGAAIHGNLSLPFSGPHFFCGFTFFEDTTDSPFPAGLTFLPRWQVVRHEARSLLVANFAVDSHSSVEQLTGALEEKLRALQTETFEVASRRQGVAFLIPPKSPTERIRAATDHALRLIAADKLQKLVLAHPLDITTTQPLPVGDTLNRLRRHYPECFTFAVGNGAGQTFWGASPERLVQFNNGEVLSDVLAGSAPRGETVVEDLLLGKTLMNNRKDCHEHQLVLDYISNQFQALGMQPQVTSPAQLMQLANIQHLRTRIRAQAPAKLNLLEILAALHPTPAVAGTPHRQACDYIRKIEIFNRHLYAAPVGWINYQGNGDFAVGIRSALSNGCQTRFYAGAGIVAGSEPAKEVAEVELKLRTLLEALS